MEDILFLNLLTWGTELSSVSSIQSPHLEMTSLNENFRKDSGDMLQKTELTCFIRTKHT